MENQSEMREVNTERKQHDFYLGLALAVLSTFFIGSSFIIKKIGLVRLNRRGGLRAGSGGFGYLKDWIWWLGLITMGVGELANFTAYAFAPASLVTPLGAISVLVSAVLASKFLKEKLNILGKLGCLLCILGSTVIVIHSPKEEQIESLDILLDKLRSYGFITYTIIVILTVLLIIFYLGPKYGEKNVLFYIILCSTVGSLTVITCKGLGLAIKETLMGKSNDFNGWFVYTFFIIVVICIFLQMNYLNKALDLFNTNVVTPVYYVFFTTFVITASAIVFNEWPSLGFEDVLGNVCGFMIVIVAIFLLNGFKETDLNFGGSVRSKGELVRGGERYSGYQSMLTRSV